MSGPATERSPTASIPINAHFKTELLHGCRFKAHRRDSYPYDILTEGGGMHVATVYGNAGDVTDENAACLAASAEMLTALVDLMTALCRSYDLPWGTARRAILAAFGAPRVRDRFVSRHAERIGNQTFNAGTAWQVVRLGFCPNRRVMVRLAALSDANAGLEYSLDELRMRFQAEEA